MTLPSNVRVVGYVTSWGMNIEIHVTSAEYRRTQGLCGSFDGNSRNDLKVKGSEQTHSPSSKSLPDVVESWRFVMTLSLSGLQKSLNSIVTYSKVMAYPLPTFYYEIR